MAITRAQFLRQAAYLASRSASWAGDCVILPEKLTEPMRDDSVSRFVTMLRETADMIEQMHAETTPDDAFERARRDAVRLMDPNPDTYDGPVGEADHD